MIYSAAPKGKIQFKIKKAAGTHLFLHACKHNFRCLALRVIQETQESALEVSVRVDTHPRLSFVVRMAT